MIAFPRAAHRRSIEVAQRRQAAGCPPVDRDRQRPGIHHRPQEQAWILVPLTVSAAEKADDPDAGRPASSDPSATLIDAELGARVLELAKRRAKLVTSTSPATSADEPEHTQIMDARPVPPAPRTQPLLPRQGHPAEPDPTEVMFALPENAPPPSSHSQASLEDTFVGRDSAAPERPVIVAHVIAPRRNLALVAAMLVWTVAVAFAVYGLASHRTAQLAPPSPSASASAPDPR